MSVRKMMAGVFAVVLMLGLSQAKVLGQTGPNMDEIRRHDADAQKVFAEERARKAAEAKSRQDEQDRLAEAKRAAEEEAKIRAKEAQWRAEEQARLEAIIATRPSTESLQNLKTENEQLRAEIARLKAQLMAVTDERDRLKAQLSKP
jgi:DNA repair exonuclease SbcCD ATPase subunit